MAEHEPLKITVSDGPGSMPLGHMLQEQANAERFVGHLNSAEYYLNQADIYEFPNPIRTECLQLAAIHASLAQALAAVSGAKRAAEDAAEDGDDGYRPDSWRSELGGTEGAGE